MAFCYWGRGSWLSVFKTGRHWPSSHKNKMRPLKSYSSMKKMWSGLWFWTLHKWPVTVFKFPAACTQLEKLTRCHSKRYTSWHKITTVNITITYGQSRDCLYQHQTEIVRSPCCRNSSSASVSLADRERQQGTNLHHKTSRQIPSA